MAPNRSENRIETKVGATIGRPLFISQREGVFFKSNSVTYQSNTSKGRFLAENMLKYI